MRSDSIELTPLKAEVDGEGVEIERTRLSQIDLEQGHAEEDADRDIVVAENVHKTYLLGAEGIAALRGVSLRVLRGDFVMLFGTSGGGKTTLLNCIGTIDKPTKGYIKVCGVRLSEKTPDNELARVRLSKLGFVFQTFNLISSLSAVENVELPMTLAGVIPPAQRRQRAIELLSKVGMGARMGHRPSQLSGGEQQRVTIARAMANRPSILLLDEPTGDLDTRNSHIVLGMLLELNAQGLTLVMVTHDVGIKQLADRVLHLRDGKLHREELIPSDQQQAARSEMLAAAAAAVAPRAATTDTDAPAEVEAVPTSLEQCRFTKLRKPQDYATHRDNVAPPMARQMSFER